METDQPRRSPAPAAVEKARKALIYADDAVHIVVAAFLVVAAVIIDAQMSLDTGERSFNENIAELGIHVAIIFVPVLCYFMIKKIVAAGD